MKGFLRLFIVAALATSLMSCSTASTDDNGDLSQFGASDQDFASFDSGGSAAADTTSEDAIEKELNAAEGEPAEAQASADEGNMDNAEVPPKVSDQANAAPAEKDEFGLFDDEDKQAAQPPPPEVEPLNQDQEDSSIAAEPAPAPEAPPEPEAPAPEIAEEPPVPEAPAPVAKNVRIKDIRYQANDSGGTVVIEGDGPMTYQTRVNESNHQFVVEIPNSQLPAKLKRSLNAKDINGNIGAIDAYQNSGSTTTRVVVQLREGASAPVVNAEGNTLLLSQGETPVSNVASNATEEKAPPQSQVLSSQNLQQFLNGNMQFYGKKISLETSEMDIRDVFKLIADESGVNLILSDEVKGTISLKLRQVPWDQALIMIMKAKKLGYTRSGNVIRIDSIADLRTEEDDAVKMAIAQKATDPLKVRLIPVSYAKIDDLKTQVTPFLSERGKVVGDTRTSSLVISDIAENIERVVKLVQSIDVPPPQVLIEGKIVEASDSFERSIGVQWNASGQPVVLGTNSGGGNISLASNLSVTPGTGSGTGITSGLLHFNLGTLDVLGSLDATLSLFENQGIAKVLSSPRILTLQNEAAEISQTEELPLIQSNLVQGSGTSTNVTFKPVKLRLAVTPQITNDGAVIMAVDLLREFAGAIVDNPSKARPVNSRAAKSKVLVKNGQTAVIGGIYQSDMTQNEAKVPWLGDIPVLGWLFKSQDVTKSKNELLIFLTPRILGQASSQLPAPMQGSTSDDFSGGEVE
jgi:type IV pilus assembly protein PilQ